MDWRQTIIEYPFLAFLVVVPIAVFAAAVKIGIILMTGRGASDDPPPDDP